MSGHLLRDLEYNLPVPLAGSIAYNAAQQITGMNYWTGSAWQAETRTYNVPNQLTRITRGTAMDVEYRYSAAANDGKITSYKNWQSGEDVQYQYDTLGQLTSAATVGPEWGQSYGYDGWGNLLSKTVTIAGGDWSDAYGDGDERHGGPGYESDFRTVV